MYARMKPMQMKHLIYLPIWFLATALTLGASLYVIQYRTQPANKDLSIAQASEDQIAPLVANYPDGEVKGISTTIESGDARAEIIARFLERHNSPLTPYEYYGEKIVEIADTYGIDYRLLPAIGMQESNLCKRIPPGSYNCLGFGVHSRGTLGFESYEANFDRAARELKKNYIDIGLVTPEQIMTKYTPSSDGSWANSVNQWIAEMEYDSRELGRTKKTNADLQEYVSE